MSNSYATDDERVKAILRLAQIATESNVGDVFVEALTVSADISSGVKRQEAEYYISPIRGLARNAEIGWRLFQSPPKPAHTLSDDEALQLITLVGTLHAFCYGAERLDEASFLTGPDSTPVRFYINSLYHYIAALYLLDKGAFPMGGTVFKVLHPMGFTDLLNPTRKILDQPLGGGLSFSETVQRIRNKFIVHGSFSPEDIASVVKQTRLRELGQQLRLTQLIWDLFNQSFILELKLMAVLTDSQIDPDRLVRYALSKE